MQTEEKQEVSGTVASRARILLSLLRINPFGKLTTSDLDKNKTPLLSVFCGRTELYSFPVSQSEAVARVQENVSQFIGNYISVFVIFFLISLCKQTTPFLVLLASFPVTDYLDNLIVKKGLDQVYPFIRRLLFFISKLGIAVLLMRRDVVIAFFSSLLAAYLGSGYICLGIKIFVLVYMFVAMLLHGSLRKLRD
ncbi:PREDICTED: PRA1 family protein H-like [Camelina sativa]|uniref:PRA1 family protein H-like n=1 Tax=Camelina sativa TaxID=90675 RepID=A0ABM0WAP1_CAMSA|nr:PREDICTED: PRA1 family protein H-like [Camelina sativa]